MKKEQFCPYSNGCFQGLGDTNDPVTIKDFLDDLKKNQFQVNLTEEDFLKFSVEGMSNSDLIIESYSPILKEKYKKEIEKNSPPVITVGTKFFLPNDQITAQMQKILSSDIFLKQEGGFPAFWMEKKKELESDKDGYVSWDEPSNGESSIPINDSRANKKRNRSASLGSGNESGGFHVQMKALNIRVWVYSHALGRIYDISPWIRVCSTQKDFQMGTFSLELVPTDTLTINTFGDDFANHFNITDKRGSINRDWFSQFIQYNDIVFIRFERLKKEKTEDKGKINSSTHIIESSALNKDLIWDMVGLVDSVSTNVDAESTDCSINISGRDFSKLLVEDGSYFIALRFVEEAPDRWFYGGEQSSSWFERNMITGEFNYFFSYDFQKIKLIASFIIDHLSNIGIVSDEVFTHCEVRQNAKGIWKMVRLTVDPILEDRHIVDRSLINPEGTLLDFFNKICQPPFVEFWGDTWGNEYDFVIRQPPFTKAAISSVVSRGEYIGIKPKDLLSYTLTYDNRIYSWYRLIPQNSLTGRSQYSALAFVPIIFLNEYVERFGNKRCMTNDIYLSENSLGGEEGEGNLSNMIQALQNDLLFAVETSCYLPFTRKGTITINGDRRIKVGTFIILESTQELFYVTNVQNSVIFTNDSVDRVSILTVERGMLLEFIPASKDSKGMNYFDVVNIDGIRSDLRKRDSNFVDDKNAAAPSKFGVNSKVFNFFLKRKMFENEND